MKLSNFFSVVVLALSFNAGAATCDVATQGQPVKFMVSVLLQRPGPEMVIKLAHAIQTAWTSAEATTRVLRQVEKSFPGYLVANTLATHVENAALSCSKPAAGALVHQQIDI